MEGAIVHLGFAPLVPWWVIGAIGAVAAVLMLLALWRRAAGTGFRFLAFALLLAALANPSLIEENWLPQSDVALVVSDDSPSLDIGTRREERDRALAELKERLSHVPNLQVRTVQAGREQLKSGKREDGGTRLFAAARRELADVPKSRQAGIILLTDGEVHDVPPAKSLEGSPPVHALLVGRPGEADRRLTLVSAPAYGIVNHEVEITFRVDDVGLPPSPNPVRVTLRRNGEVERTVSAITGRNETVQVRLDRGGTTYFELEAAAGPRELSLVNNRAVAAVNAVRDRLRVLLVSGAAHLGERVWRNLLKSDPSVDLVHFTILRPPEKQDATPIRELSLIAFPIRELFETKLDEFDLIIFDDYAQAGIIPPNYFANVARYVRDGGALLEAVGPGFARPATSLFRSPLGEVYPAEPTGRVLLEGYRPALSDPGKRHPVTAPLADLARRGERWGRWFQLVETDTRAGTTLMQGAEGRPLVVVDRVGKGRVGLVLSDQIWLWARGFEGGGPHGELLRRLAHWLMKEPELEEDALVASVDGDRLQVERRSLEPDRDPVTVTAPDGKERTLTLTDQQDGRATGTLEVDAPGLYRVKDPKHTTVAAAGPPNPLEYSDLRATADVLRPALEATGGEAVWLSEHGIPEVRQVSPGRASAGRGWIGLVANRDHIVTGLRERPALPAWLALALAVALLGLTWWREAR